MTINKTAAISSLLLCPWLGQAQDSPVPAIKPLPSASAGSAAGIASTPTPATPAKAGNKSGSSYHIAQNRNEFGAAGDDVIQFRGGGENVLWASDSRGSRARTLIVRSSDLDGKKTEQLEEDMAVMARLLDKGIEQHGEANSTRKAMGIQVFSFAGGKPARNIYLEGYGAIFMLNVPFPLVQPAEKAAEPASKEKESSEWEEAKGELYGVRPSRDRGFEAVRGRFEEYDPGKVQDLKENVLRALKNATHIRGLKPEDNITIVISGAPENMQVRSIKKGVSGGGGAAGGSARVERDIVTMAPGAAGNDSTMTVRVKKGDADAYAKNNLSHEDFAKKAKITIY